MRTCLGMRKSACLRRLKLTRSNAHSNRSSPSAPQHGGQSTDVSNTSSEHAGGSNDAKPSTSSTFNDEEYTTRRQPTYFDLDEASLAAEDVDDEDLDGVNEPEEGEVYDGAYPQPHQVQSGLKQHPNGQPTQAEDGEVAALALNASAHAGSAPAQSSAADNELYDLDDADEPLRFE